MWPTDFPSLIVRLPRIAFGALAGLVLAAAPVVAAPCPTAEDRGKILADTPADWEPCEASAVGVDLAWSARARMRRSQYAEAAALWRRVLPSAPGNDGKVVVWLMVAKAQAAAGDPEGALRTLDVAHPSRRWLGAEVEAARASYARDAGRWSEVLQHVEYAQARNHPSDDALEALRLDALKALGRHDEVSNGLRRLGATYPESPVTRSLPWPAGPADDTQPADPAWLSQRWARLIATGQADATVTECLPRWQGLGGDPSAVARARLECGRALSSVRRPEAADVLREAAQYPGVRASALMSLARVLGRSSDVEAVHGICRQVRSIEGNVSDYVDCLMLEALLLRETGRADAARRVLTELLEEHGRSGRARDAAWQLALDAMHQNPDEAAERLAGLVKGARGATDKAQFLYWRARVRPPTERQQARDEWNQVLKMDPGGYYGWLASARLGLARDVADVRDASCSDPRPAVSDRGRLPSAAAFGQWLIDVGLRRLARTEIADLRRVIRSEGRAWIPLLEGARLYNRVVDIGQGGGGMRVLAGAIPELAWAAFPVAFPEALSLAPAGVDRCLLLSLMRRESRFDPHVASPAQARGLMQLLPTTADRLAREAGLPRPSIEELFDPTVNVSLGGLYVQRLVDRFRHPLIAAAAYNAGPRVTAQWLTAADAMDIDEWVERIPFKETRSYVKAVGGAFAAYHRVYSQRTPLPGFGAPPRPGPGIDF